MQALVTLTRRQGANRALVDGDLRPDGYDLVFADEPVLVRGFRKMVRGLAYDVAEMALTTYLTAKEHGAAFTALPIFLVRGLHHGAIRVRRGGPVTEPADLENRRVGVSRGYTVTTGVWARAVLAEEHGVDLDRITWVPTGDEHVEGFAAPANVAPALGADPVRLLLNGEVEAVVGAVGDHPELVPLIPDPETAALAAVRARGLFPINHLVVVRDDLLAADPELAPALFRAFARAKQEYVSALRSGRTDEPQDRMLAAVMDAWGRDPLPYGLEPNRAVLDHLVGHLHRQHILTRPVDLDDVFAAGTHGLTG